MIKIVSRLILLILMLSCLQTSCKNPEISDADDLLTFLYARSADTIEINSISYFLETYLYRNLMPGAFKDRSLVAVAFLVRSDSVSIPSEITMSRLYVIQNHSAWISVPKNSTDAYVPEYKLSKVSTDGPEWDTEIKVDVVAEIINRASQKKYFLIARDQDIQRPE